MSRCLISYTLWSFLLDSVFKLGKTTTGKQPNLDLGNAMLLRINPKGNVKNCESPNFLDTLNNPWDLYSFFQFSYCPIFHFFFFFNCLWQYFRVFFLKKKKRGSRSSLKCRHKVWDLVIESPQKVVLIILRTNVQYSNNIFAETTTVREYTSSLSCILL